MLVYDCVTRLGTINRLVTTRFGNFGQQSSPLMITRRFNIHSRDDVSRDGGLLISRSRLSTPIDIFLENFFSSFHVNLVSGCTLQNADIRFFKGVL